MEQQYYEVGTKVLVVDPINQELYPEKGTIIFIEPDNEIPILWLYIKADDDSLNKQYDSRFGKYWVIREHESELLYLQ